MISDYEEKTITAMTNAMVEVIQGSSDINPMQAMMLVGYAARQVVRDLSRAMMLDPQQAIITSLGAMLPEAYLKALTSANQIRQTASGCGGSM